MNAAEYLESLPFPADRFQHEAVAAIDRGESVVVAAPTGSGKTVVAEAAIVSAVADGRRAFYTTPIKALSNQKFGDLSEQHGEENVGLLTGDNSINGDAPIVVMTTEVLRNMMYSDGPDLIDLGVVILDEVHYLQDPARGAVWEEIIIHLDRTVPLVCLSATIPNAAEFSEWVGGRRGPTSLVVETVRPVPLDSGYLLKDRWESGRLRLMDVLQSGAPNPTLLRMLRRHPGRKRYGTPRRFETCDLLARRGMLPAIYFIFSRAGCSAAANQVVDFGLRLTTAEEAARLASLAAELEGVEPEPPPPETAIGGLIRHLQASNPATFQPSNINWGLMSVPPEMAGIRDRRERRERHAAIAIEKTRDWARSLGGE